MQKIQVKCFASVILDLTFQSLRIACWKRKQQGVAHGYRPTAPVLLCYDKCWLCLLLLLFVQFHRVGRVKADTLLFLVLSSCSLAVDFICLWTWSSIKEAMSNWKEKAINYLMCAREVDHHHFRGQLVILIGSSRFLLMLWSSNRPFSNSHGWTWSSMKSRLMQANLFKCKLICPH